MMFRKNSLLFFQSEIFYIVMTVLSLVLTLSLGVGVSFVYGIPFAVLALANPKLHNEIITIDERGILCQKDKIQIWAYEWECIAEFKQSSRFLFPAIEVVTNDTCEKKSQIPAANHYFQLCKTARKAIEKYYIPTKTQ